MITKFPSYYVMGANTNVGKTIFSAALCLQGLKQNLCVHYIKPIQTGFPVDCDHNFISDYCKSALSMNVQNALKTEQIFGFEEAVSPHRVIKKAPQQCDEGIVAELYKKIDKSTANLLLIETAGGVASPTVDGALQCNLYRKLNLPVIFVADSKLGGISTAISSIELLVSRGFKVACVLVFKGEHENSEFLKKYYKDKIEVFAFKDVENETFDIILDFLISYHAKQFQALSHDVEIAKKHIWWPFTQHQNVQNPQIIISALGDDFCVFNREYRFAENVSNILSQNIYDASASWWTQGIGHASIPLAQAASAAMGQFGHVMFPGNVHAPAAQLTKKMIETVGKGWADRVFFSDNGSTAIEVALKMAFRKSCPDHTNGKQIIVLGLKDSYHGDTHAAMDATSPNAFKDKDIWYHPRGIWLNYPTLFMKSGQYFVLIPDEFDMCGTFPLESNKLEDFFSHNRLNTTLAHSYRKFIQKQFEYLPKSNFKIGACVLEGVIQGSGGMQFVDPIFQIILIEECRKRAIPIILDEVFTGFWRLGEISASHMLGVNPDIACYGKLLTGGLLPMAVTLATEDIFSQFLSDTKSTALLHGHSYTGNPVACATALAAIDEIKLCKNFNVETQSLKNLWDESLVKKISDLKNIKRVLAIGSLFALELDDNNAGYLSYAAKNCLEALKNADVDARSLGNVVYIMAGFNTEKTRLDFILETLGSVVQSV